MRLRNLTHSPYAVPTKDGGQVIIPAFEVADVDLQDDFPLDDAFWRVEPDDKQPSKKDRAQVTPSEEDETPEEDEDEPSEDNEDDLEEADEEADTSGDTETPEVPAPRPVLSARKKGRRR